MAEALDGLADPIQQKKTMVLQFLFGFGVSVINIMIHALVTVGAVAIARSAGLHRRGQLRLHLIGVMVGTAAALMVAHTLEIFVWALAYLVVGAASADSGMLYFAFVNYTTLGYGDITPVQSWRLIGPMTAMNGILMFGWSTAVLFEVLRKTLESFPLIGTAEFNSADRDRRAAFDREERSDADCCR